MAITDKLTAIANAIRTKTGKTGTMTMAQMATEIAGIPMGNAKEPFVEERFNSLGKLADAKLHGYTAIRDNMFEETAIAWTSIPDEITTIGRYAFRYCVNLRLSSLPSGLIKIGEGAFRSCPHIELTSLPRGVTKIEYETFIYTHGFTEMHFHAGITYIGREAFRECTDLLSVTFEGTPTTIASSVFESCTNLATINVPWADGEVANAPWGATNATINYNYVAPTTEETT